MSRTFLFKAFAALVAVALIAPICFRPAFIVGPNDESLAHSLRRAVDGPETGNCTEVGSGWRCRVLGESAFQVGVAGPSRTYLAEVGDWGCWEARMIDGKSGDYFPGTIHGCITIGDLLRPGG